MKVIQLPLLLLLPYAVNKQSWRISAAVQAGTPALRIQIFKCMMTTASAYVWRLRNKSGNDSFKTIVTEDWSFEDKVLL